MIKSTEILDVIYETQIVGKLAVNRSNLAVFEYDTKWLEKGFSISPIYLPLEAKTYIAKQDPFDGLFGVFNDSLPDGWGRLLIDRYMRSVGVNPHSLGILDKLSLVGRNGMGALSYIPHHEILTDDINEDLDFYAKEVANILASGAESNLEMLIARAGSSAGVRPKVIIRIDNEEWLVKFPAQYDNECIGETEYHCSIMARRCDIEMSDTQLFKGKYFGTKLFDRTQNHRIHVHSASGILYASHRFPSLDYEDLLKLTHYITKDFTEVEKMFNLMVFNVIIGNKDDHARNFSFIYKDNCWKLSPAYDLTPSYGFNGQHSTTLNGKGNPEKEDIIALAKKIGFPQKEAKQIIERISDIVMIG